MDFNDILKSLSGAKQKVRMYEPAPATARLDVPKADETYFYTAGRAVSYFPKINANGFTFFREDCKAIAKSLMASLADIEHIKPGYPSADPENEKNTSMGAICDLIEHEEGIDVLCKNEREIAKAMGYKEEDFQPFAGKYCAFSQECDFKALDSTWVVVDKDDPTKIVKQVGYLEGIAQGFRCSRQVGSTWEYYYHDGNPVYVSLKPISFTGVGHVINPADTSAVIYSYAADDTLKLLALFPGMDGDAGDDVGAMVRNQGEDLMPFATDLRAHPDIITSTVGAGDDFHMPDDFCSCTTPNALSSNDSDKPYGEVRYADPGFRDKKARYPIDTPEHVRAAARYFGQGDNKSKYSPEQQAHIEKAIHDAEMHHGIGESAHENFAAVWGDSTAPNKAFQVKSGGQFDRSKLVTAYNALTGMRGNTALAARIPIKQRAHALMLVRQGLNETKTKETNKSVSQIEKDLLEIEDRKTLIAEMELNSNKAVSTLKETLEAEHSKALAAKDDEVAALKAEVEKLTASIKEYADKEVSSARLAKLEEILPYSDDEKKADTFGDFVKALASFTDDRFETEALRRQNQALAKQLSEVGSQKATAARTNPIPLFSAETEIKAEDQISVGIY